MKRGQQMTCRCYQRNVSSHLETGGVGQAGKSTGFRSRVNNSFTTCSDLLSGRWKPGKYLMSIKHQHATFDAGRGALLGLRATGPCSVVGNPSRACLVLPGALSISTARYFTTPSRPKGLAIDRAVILTSTSGIFDEAGAGQSA